MANGATKDSMCVTILSQSIDPLEEFCLNLKNRKLSESWLDLDPSNGELKRALIEGHLNL